MFTKMWYLKKNSYKILLKQVIIFSKVSEINAKWIKGATLSISLFGYEKASNFEKMYLLPKIHKKLFNVPGRLVLSNCGSPTGKVLGFLDSHPKGIM